MLLPNGGVIDDLIVYFLAENFFRLVINAGTREKDMAWIRRHAQAFAVTALLRQDLAMLAIQGPNARQKTLALLAPERRAAALELRPFYGALFDSWFIARTGYTGEDGFEVMLPAGEAGRIWNALRAQGIAPAGLGARDNPAAGSRHEPVRQRHGRTPSSPGVGPGLDRGPSIPATATFSAGRRSRICAAPAVRNSWACCSRIAACCAAIRRW